MSGGSPDTFVADLTALANDTPEVTPPAPSDGTTPNGLVAALNNLADRIPSVADIAGDGQNKKTGKSPIHEVLQVSQGSKLSRYHPQKISGSPSMF